MSDETSAGMQQQLQQLAQDLSGAVRENTTRHKANIERMDWQQRWFGILVGAIVTVLTATGVGLGSLMVSMRKDLHDVATSVAVVATTQEALAAEQLVIIDSLKEHFGDDRFHLSLKSRVEMLERLIDQIGEPPPRFYERGPR